MKVHVEISLIPLGVGVSLSPYIAECERVFEEAGLRHDLHADGTTVVGEWSEVFSAIEQCHRRVHDQSVPRIYTTLKVSTRTDREQQPEERVESVRRKLAEQGDGS